MMSKAAVLIFLLSCAVCAAYFSIDEDTGHFLDASGRNRLFHGVNVVYKLFPYYPPAPTFDPQLSFVEEDAEFLLQNGFTAVRLFIAWPGVEPEKGQYNASYLDVIESLVNLLGAKGIATILDCHQDLMSPMFCGEGFPDYAVNYKNSSESPVAFPVPIPSLTPYKVDKLTGYPSRNECNSHQFYLYYMSDASCKAWQSFYDNEQGVQDQFLLFWKAVATRFESNVNVLGYELLNEPWTGDIYTKPELFEPSLIDSKYLAPLYKDLHTAIRSVDKNHIIFFEPVSDFLSDFPLGNLTPSGFKEGPGGSQYNDRQAFSYHVYCPLMNSHGQPLNSVLCDLADANVIGERLGDVKRMNVSGAFISEWGAFDNFLSDSVTAKNGREFLNLADYYLQSWTYWQFKGYDDITTQTVGNEGLWDSSGGLQEAKVKLLSRTYAPMVAGQYVSMSFNPISAAFSVTYKANTASPQPTVIFINQKYYYSNGYTARCSPPNSVSFTFESPFIEARHAASVQNGQVLTIYVVAK